MSEIKVITSELLKKYDAKAQDRQSTVDVKTLTDAKGYTDLKVGPVPELTTTAKDNIVTAVNEVAKKVTDMGTSGTVTIDTSTTSEGMSKSYTVKQGESTIGVIDVPKDMVVSKAHLVTVSDNHITSVDDKSESPDLSDFGDGSVEKTNGIYLVLIIANASNDKVWINLNSLVDTYTAKQDATQIQITVNPSTREISAAVVAGSITDTELASNAVTTQKIADANVTKAKLASDVTDSLTKADSAIQKVEESTTNGSIKVDGNEVAVHGLASGAFIEITEATEEDIDAIFAGEGE